jgi:antitoxin CptB
LHPDLSKRAESGKSYCRNQEDAGGTATLSPEAAQLRDTRIRWQCRRGTRELDYLLLSWFESSYAAASDAQKSAFRALLELQDPELVAYLLRNTSPADSRLADVVHAVRTRSST